MDVSVAAGLLTIASSMDNRKVDEETAQIWAKVLDGIDPLDAQAAVLRHYSVPGARWMMPGDVIAGVRAIEGDRLAAAPNVYELEPPKRVTDLDGEAFDAAYLDWIQDTTRKIRRGEPYETGTRPPAVDDAAKISELVAAVNVAHRAS